LQDIEIYFLTNQSGNPVEFEAAFRVTGKKPELWDPANGMIRDLPAFIKKDEVTSVPLTMDAFGSAFIVFRKRGNALSERMETNFPEPKTLVTISTPWEVSFDKAMGGPEGLITMPDLEDWTKSNDERIRYYSGTAIYKNTFVIDKIPRGETVYLDLGHVYVMAEVKVNGKPAGGVWTPPWQVDITDLVESGENSIEVDVVNNWINRLIGDSRLPEKDRSTWINVNQIKPDDPLQPSGLMGPVSVVSVRY
jgi:hypothetical protein